MSFFKEEEATNAFLKMGMMGFQGSGKTYTAAQVAIGIVKMQQAAGLNGTKPIAFIDTEKGSDWIRPIVMKAGLRFATSKTRAFADLLQAVPDAEKNASVLIVDSVTHFWTELCESYCAQRAREMRRETYRLQFQDWGTLKKKWREFTDLFVNSSLHMIICGRAGYEYDFFEDEAGKKQLEKTGIKFKAEGEMGYEPDLLVLMERRMNMETKADIHMAHVIKDRSTLLDGKEIEDPTFESFLPHIKCLNLGGHHLGVDTSRNSEGLIPTDKKDWNPVQRRIVLDEIGDLMTLHGLAGRKEADMVRKTQMIRKHFNNASWAEIEEVMPLPDIRAGYDGLHRELEGKSSRYGVSAPLPTALPLAADAPIDDISHILDAPAPKPPSLKEKILADIASNQTIMDCAVYGNAVAKMKDLSPEDKDEIGAALDLHRIKINGAVAA